MYSVECIDIAVVTFYVVDFDWVVKVLAVVEDLQLGLWILLCEDYGNRQQGNKKGLHYSKLLFGCRHFMRL